MRSRLLLLLQVLAAVFIVAKPVYSIAETEAVDENSEKELVDEDIQDCGTCVMSIGNPVCGDDGISYQNDCLANCQNVTIKSTGECPGDRSMNYESYDTIHNVTRSELDRFADEGFVLVAKRTFTKFVRPDQNLNAFQDSNGPLDMTNFNPAAEAAAEAEAAAGKNQTLNDDDDDGNIIIMRKITGDGTEYAKKIDLRELPDVVRDFTLPHSAPVKQKHGPRKRKLQKPPLYGGKGAAGIPAPTQPPYSGKGIAGIPAPTAGPTFGNGIIGSDTRERVCRSNCPYPLSSIGEFDNDAGEGGCTGTVISPTTVITAAHCHYINGKFTDLNQFAPGRYRNNGVVYNPYGVYSIASRTIFNNWDRTYDTKYDIALITFDTRIGDRTGYLGISTTTNDSNQLQDTSVTGYPLDKAKGEMWTSGTCAGGFQKGPNKHLTYYGCDVVKGMDGSGLINLGTLMLYGLHIADDPSDHYPSDPYANVGVVLDSSSYALIKMTAGL